MAVESEEKNSPTEEVQISAETPADGHQVEDGAFKAYLRIFTFGGATEKLLQALSIAAALGTGAGIALQNLVFGSFITTISDFASGRSSPDTFQSEAGKLALYFVYIGIARFVLSYIYISLTTFAAYRVTRNIRHEYLRAALRQEVAFFDSGTSGSIASQAVSNGRLIQVGIAEKLALTFQGVAVLITAFAIAFATQWKLTLITMCIAPAILIIIGITSTIEAAIETKIHKIYAEAGSFAEGVLSSARTVHAFEIRSRLVERYNRFLQDAHNLGNKKSPLFGLLFSTEYFVINAGFGLAFWQGVQMMSRGEIDSSGDIFTVLLSVIIGATSLTILAPYIIEFTRAGSAAANLFRIIDRVSDIDALSKSGDQPIQTVGELQLENVTFSYPTRPGVTVLSDFSLHVPAGKVTALVGASGSGKSTIIGLIERWYNPKSGCIKLDGRAIDQLNVNWLRKNIRLVQQEPVLFQASVFENIANGLVGTPWEHVTKEEQMAQVQAAAKIAFAHDFIVQLPEGYDTHIGERGGLLSGGQKQRVAIARSIVSEPKVLLLDEATSALDPHAEGIVQKALDRASEGRTTIVIAHKLATIRNADNIVVMSQGSIVEQGTHDSLLQQGSAYARLVNAQSLAVLEGGSITETEEEDEQDIRAKDDNEATRTLSRHQTNDQRRMEIQRERDNFDNHKPLGLFGIVVRMMKESPEIRWAYILTLVTSLGSAGMFPGQALIIAELMDVFNLTGSDFISRSNFFALMFLVVAFGVLIFYLGMGWSTNVIAQTLNHKFRRQILDDFLRQDLQFFDRQENNTGAMASRLDSNPQSILELMGFNIALILIAVFNVAACSILAIAYTWKFGLVVVLAGMPPLACAGLLKIRLETKLDSDISKHYTASAGLASEAVNAIRTVSSLAIEESVLKRYTTELNHAIRLSTKPLFTMTILFSLTQSIEHLFLALGFWYGCRLLSLEEISMYQFFVAFMGTYFSGIAASMLFQYSSSLTKCTNAANYIFWLHDLEPVIQDTQHNRDATPKTGDSVSIESLRFSYPLRPDAHVLRGVNLEIKKGQFVALVGASGCGKSTIIAMLERFYDPTTGHIRIDGDALPDLNPRLYRRIVALVQQEPTLFQGSIRENIALGLDTDEIIPDSTIESACRAANAWEFISSLPEGLSTPCGSNGLQLSGGQRQRIAIARALIRNPKVLLLDEATSALDTESEKIVQKALSDAAVDGQRITIAVAHRLSTVKDADVICVFYQGKIVERGTHSQLVAKGGMYKQMCEAQNLE